MPINLYEVSAQKYGYNLENIYEISSETNDTREEINRFDLNILKELVVEMTRTPTSIDGKFMFENSEIPNANISFSPIHDPAYSLTLRLMQTVI